MYPLNFSRVHTSYSNNFFMYLPVEQNVKSFLSFYPSLQEFKIWLVGQGILCHINDVGQNKVQVNINSTYFDSKTPFFS